ncbi:MAG: hypothetical protein INH41_05120 [Myxococcaceae bacterium]|jgi:hypothetical protein|nr:hypothetical protein [Myxococcaceae bacterium]MCA3011765.1 hypothetical protein [Myxococcaceae bacterium]
MPVLFNPFNPMTYVNAWTSAVTSADLGRARLPRSTPIPVVAKSLNSGITTRVKQVGAETHVTFSGTAKGPTSRDVFGGALRSLETSHPVQLSVAVEEAPSTDALGRRNFSERNNRAMVTSPRGGETGAALAETFARQINRDLMAFRATVKPGATANSAVLVISRR